MLTKYNGNDVFAPFNAGLYGLDDGGDRSLQYDDSKAEILRAFEKEYKKEIIETLASAGIEYKGLEYWSPKYYNYSTDSIDLEIEIVDRALLLAALEKHRPAIEKAMADNKSYDGYMALTANTWDQMLEKLDSRGLDIIAVTVLLSGIDFEDFDIYDHLVYEYACDDCKMIHADTEYHNDDQKKKVADCIAARIKADQDATRDANNLKLPL